MSAPATPPLDGMLVVALEPAVAAYFSRSRIGPVLRAVPACGEHTEAVLAEIGQDRPAAD
jgi:hypothetical protein